MVMTLQLTRMVVMMAKPNMGWVKTVRAIRRIGWKGERIHIAFVAENLRRKSLDELKIILQYTDHVNSRRLDRVLLSTMYLDIAPPLLMTMKVLLSA